MWTLQYITAAGVVEKPFSTQPGCPVAGWGFSGQCPFEFHATSKSAVHVLTTNNFDDAFTFAHNSKVIIWRNRVYAANAFSGGAIWFQGFVSQPQRVATGAKQNHQYTFFNWMDWAERIGFRQPYNIRSGGTYANPAYTTDYSDEVVLGETLEEITTNVAYELAEVLNALNQRYNPTRWRSHVGAVDATKDLVQLGALYGGAVPMPRQPMTCVACYEALKACLKQIPDAVLWTDYTTTPPTVNVTQIAAMGTAVMNLPSADLTQIFPGLKLKPRYDRQLNGVLIAYKQPVEEAGELFMGVVYDKYPPAADQDDPLVMSYVVTLNGAKINVTNVTVLTIEVDPTSLAWWQQHDDRLNNPRIVADSLSVVETTITDKNGNAIDLGQYPFQLMPDSGAPVPGMGVNTIEAIIKGTAKWTLNHATIPDLKTDDETGAELVARVTLCDLDTGGAAKSFSASSIASQGEAAPVGLAEYLYNAFSALQYEGSLDTAGQDIRGDIALGQKMTINTPGGNYPNSLIQSVSGEIFHGVLKAEIGPPSVLGLSDIIEQIRTVRYVPGWKLPSGRSTGTAPGAGTTGLQNVTPKENTIPSHLQPAYKAFVDPATGNINAMDPAQGLIVIM